MDADGILSNTPSNGFGNFCSPAVFGESKLSQRGIPCLSYLLYDRRKLKKKTSRSNAASCKSYYQMGGLSMLRTWDVRARDQLALKPDMLDTKAFNRPSDGKPSGDGQADHASAEG